MNELTRIARWVERLEQDLDSLQQRKAHTEGRIAKKIRTLVKMANEGGVVDREALLASLAALEAKIANAEMTHKTLEEVEQEVDRIYGDQSKNETYYFSRRNKGASERVAATFKNLNDLGDWINRQLREAERNAGDVERNLDHFLAMSMQLRRDELVNQAHLDTFFKRMEKRLSRLPSDRFELEMVYSDVLDEFAGMVKRIKAMRGGRFDRQSASKISNAFWSASYVPSDLNDFRMYLKYEVDELYREAQEYSLPVVHEAIGSFRDDMQKISRLPWVQGTEAEIVLKKLLGMLRALPGPNDEDGISRMLRSLSSVVNAFIKRTRNAGSKVAVNGLNPIGNTILEQMGGRRLSAMLGVQQYYDIRNGVGFKWPNRQRSKGNYVEIVLNGKDLYDMTFFNVSRSGKKRVAQFNDLFAESLVRVFEDHTGWYLRLASVNASEESTDSSSGYKPRDLEDVQDDYDNTYGDQGKNDTYYDMPASEYKTELYKDLEALTTYVYGEEHESEWDGKMDQGFDSMKNASPDWLRDAGDWWRDALEEDGLVIDPADQLDLGQPGPYDYNAPEPLDENHPLGMHDWNGHDPMDGLLGRQSKVQEAARKLMATLHSDHDLRDVAARKEVLHRLASRYQITRAQAARIAKTLEAHPVTLNTPAACGRVASALMNVL